MKSRILIITVVFILVPLLAGAASLHLAVKMGAGCPFKAGPNLERCNPTLNHSKLNPDDLVMDTFSFTSVSSTLTAFPSVQVDEAMSFFPLEALTAFPLRC
jgi:hypothetical protein